MARESDSVAGICGECTSKTRRREVHIEDEKLARGARIEDEKLTEGVTPRQEIFGRRPDSPVSAHSLLSSAPFLNFIKWAAPGAFCHLSAGWNVANDSGILELSRPGGARA